MAQFKVAWKIAFCTDGLNVGNRKVWLDGKNCNGIFTTVGSVDKSTISRNVNGCGSVMSGPVSRNGLDGLQVSQEASAAL